MQPRSAGKGRIPDMVTDERISAFLLSLERPQTGLAAQMEAYAKEHEIPIIRKEMESLLRTLMKIRRPRRVLEVGTAIGYSGILLAGELPREGELITIENYEPRIRLAKENFEKSGLADRITLLEGDAAVILPTLAGPFDFIFMDAAKGQYIHFLPEILRLLSEGGVLVTDNVFQDGDIFESRYAVERRDRTIHARMREYLHALKNTEGLTTTILALGDGAAVSVKDS